MKILVLHNRYRLRGGEDVAVDDEISRARQAGLDIAARIVSNDTIAGWPGWLRAASGVARSKYGTAFVEEAIRETRPDVLHVHNFFPLLSPAVHAAARAQGVATVQSLHNFRTVCANGLLMRQGRSCETCIDGSPWWGAWHACYRDSTFGSLAVARMIDTHRRAGTWSNDVDRFIVMSEFARSRFARAGLPAEKMVVRRNTVDDPGPPKEFRTGIVYAGRLSEEKGVRILIDAARHSTAPIEVIGDGPLAAELRRIAPPNVLFRGTLPRDVVRQRIASAEALVVPSVCYEGSPIVIAEAYAAATPVIASRIGALEGLVQDEQTGLLTAPGNARQLAESLARISVEKSFAREMGHNARAYYTAEWSPQASIGALTQIYADAIAAFRGAGDKKLYASTMCGTSKCLMIHNPAN